MAGLPRHPMAAEPVRGAWAPRPPLPRRSPPRSATTVIGKSCTPPRDRTRSWRLWRRVGRDGSQGVGTRLSSDGREFPPVPPTFLPLCHLGHARLVTPLSTGGRVMATFQTSPLSPLLMPHPSVPPSSLAAPRSAATSPGDSRGVPPPSLSCSSRARTRPRPCHTSRPAPWLPPPRRPERPSARGGRRRWWRRRRLRPPRRTCGRTSSRVSSKAAVMATVAAAGAMPAFAASTARPAAALPPGESSLGCSTSLRG